MNEKTVKEKDVALSEIKLFHPVIRDRFPVKKVFLYGSYAEMNKVSTAISMWVWSWISKSWRIDSKQVQSYFTMPVR